MVCFVYCKATVNVINCDEILYGVEIEVAVV